MSEHDVIYLLAAAFIIINAVLVYKYYIKTKATKVKRYFTKRIMGFQKRRRMKRAGRYAKKQVHKLLKKFN